MDEISQEWIRTKGNIQWFKITGSLDDIITRDQSMPRVTPSDCPADAARHDCAGCRDRAACIAETRARLQHQDQPHTRPIVTEESIPRPIAPIIDGDTGQRIQYLRVLVESKTRPEEHVRLQNQIRHDIQDSGYAHRFSLRRLR